jgi:hypothetical protein
MNMNTPDTPQITQMRAHLMDALAALKDRDHPMEPDRARAMAQVAGVLVDSAKVEVEFLKVTGQEHSAFLGGPQASHHTLPAPNTTPQAHNPFPSASVHRLQG